MNYFNVIVYCCNLFYFINFHPCMTSNYVHLKNVFSRTLSIKFFVMIHCFDWLRTFVKLKTRVKFSCNFSQLANTFEDTFPKIQKSFVAAERHVYTSDLLEIRQKIIECSLFSRWQFINERSLVFYWTFNWTNICIVIKDHVKIEILD